MTRKWYKCRRIDFCHCKDESAIPPLYCDWWEGPSKLKSYTDKEFLNTKDCKMTLEQILQYAYDNETNIQINSFWDNGYDVKIGDNMNGYSHECNFRRGEFEQIAHWIDIALKDRYKQIAEGKLETFNYD